jgi:hypothetical protein
MRANTTTPPTADPAAAPIIVYGADGDDDLSEVPTLFIEGSLVGAGVGAVVGERLDTAIVVAAVTVTLIWLERTSEKDEDDTELITELASVS